MNAAHISQQLSAGIIGREVFVYHEVTSTNDVAADLGKSNYPEGAAVFAETQTAGRGRLGRRWQSSEGQSLIFSILVRPAWPDVSRLSLAATVAIARALDPLTKNFVGIKWPNDIFIGGKKVAGILCEASQGYVVIGIGINIFQKETDFPVELAARAGSVSMFSSVILQRDQIAINILAEFDRIYQSLPESFPEIIAECERRSILLGRTISVEMGANRICGVVAGTEQDGALKLIDATGGETLVSAGEVTLLEI